ncbi:transcriptional regulator [Streptomyces sp. NPDC052415]|uniref:transcriptional regulator n=1 Tax=Streptomyces sp. NPDC052415 TaxID=3365690 RepID=UPI0037D0CE31
MTALRATPAGLPPRLPSRDRSTAGERAPRGLSPMLSRLAAERATGVLLRECGTLYLAQGRVVHAESPAAPGLDVLLTAHGTLDTAVWQDAVTRADDLHGAARLLVDSGRLTPGTLELCHLGALYDAAYFALAPSSTPGRFRYGTGHWLGPVRPVPVAAVERETLRRRDLLHRIWPDPGTDSAPLTRADPPRAPALTARQRAVVALLDGARTATDIARALGRPAFHTLVDIRRLAAAGVLAPRPPHPTPARPTHPDREPTPQRTHPEPADREPTPQRPHPDPPDRGHTPQQTRTEPPDRGPTPQRPHPDPPDRRPAPEGACPHPADPPSLPVRPRPPAPAERLAPDDPDVALLRRVRDALEAL